MTDLLVISSVFYRQLTGRCLQKEQNFVNNSGCVFHREICCFRHRRNQRRRTHPLHCS